MATTQLTVKAKLTFLVLFLVASITAVYFALNKKADEQTTAKTQPVQTTTNVVSVPVTKPDSVVTNVNTPKETVNQLPVAKLESEPKQTPKVVVQKTKKSKQKNRSNTKTTKSNTGNSNSNSESNDIVPEY